MQSTAVSFERCIPMDSQGRPSENFRHNVLQIDCSQNNDVDNRIHSKLRRNDCFGITPLILANPSVLDADAIQSSTGRKIFL